MSPIDIRIDVTGDKVIKKRYRGMDARAGNMAPVFSAITRDFRQIMVRQFDTQGAYLSGRKWAKLRPKTVKIKSEMNADPRILHRTRVMRKSFTQGRGGFRLQTRDTLLLGSKDRAAGFHDTGTKWMKKRKIAGVTQFHRRRWSRMVADWIKTGQVKTSPL